MSVAYKNFAIIYNPAKPHTQAVAERLEGILQKLGAKAAIYTTPLEDLGNHDAAASVGGDGTLLGCVPAALSSQIPLIGVNMGRLGYLTTIGKDELKECFMRILSGEYMASPRMVLKVTMSDGSVYYALNDLVIKSAEYRLADLEVSVDDELVTEYDCDGLIFATPTGSTAYNLSAGGPIVHLRAEGIVMSPICAHTLTNRSVIFNSHSRLGVNFGATPCQVHINVDGRAVAESRECLPLQVRQATRKLMILEDPRRGPFETLRQKLGWR